MAAPRVSEPPEATEGHVRAQLKERQQFFDRVWDSGASGKAFVVLILLAYAAPFIFDIFAVLAVWLWIWPATNTVTEKLAALSFLFIVLNVVAWQAARWASLLWEYAYVMRPRRNRERQEAETGRPSRVSGSLTNDVQELVFRHKPTLVDEVEAERTELDLVPSLVGLVPMSHGGIDRTHVVWARALRDSVWLGWLSHAKAADGRYPKDLPEAIRRSLEDAFAIGAEYSKERK